MNMQTRVAVVVASAAMILSVAGPISARQPTASSTKEADSATAEALISKMVSTGASQKSIDRVLKARLGWVRSDAAETKRLDRRADRDDDADLRRYNEQLAALSRREQP